MINDYIGGGQVFLHKVRMLRQVIGTTIFVSLLGGFCITWLSSGPSSSSRLSHASSSNHNHSSNPNLHSLDLDGATTYAKAKLALILHPALSSISISKSKAKVDAYSNGKLYQKQMLASKVISSPRFKLAWQCMVSAINSLVIKSLSFGGCAGLLVFVLWSKFGRKLKEEKTKDGSARVLTADEVSSKLKKLDKCSDLYVGNMPLVKDSETRHFLVTGSTGSGKTSLVHHLLSQIEKKSQPALIVDQTGEMIARYYNPSRGDIIFNPFDARSKTWDFWQDCASPEELAKFSKILFSFNRKRSGYNSDPFWEQSAECVFNECASFLINNNQDNKISIKELVQMTVNSNLHDLKQKLKNTQAERYLTDDGKGMGASVLSVLATTAKPISHLIDNTTLGQHSTTIGKDITTSNTFSLKKHFASLKAGGQAWLFLSTKPSSRELTLPLIACLTELALTKLMDIGIDKNRKVWCIFDELAALGNLPALSSLMSEGRKYGACVIAALQSLNQLYDHYGQYAASSIFGQFGTSFFFRSNEPAIAKIFSSMCGSQTITRQQKNTSFGANTHRDGVSYNEQQQKQPLVEFEQLASLVVGECYVLLPEPEVRISKVQVPEDKEKDKVEGFVEIN